MQPFSTFILLLLKLLLPATTSTIPTGNSFQWFDENPKAIVERNNTEKLIGKPYCECLTGRCLENLSGFRDRMIFYGSPPRVSYIAGNY